MRCVAHSKVAGRANVVNASRVHVHGMEGNDITCLICHSGWADPRIELEGP
jgi:hypothetical protein